MQLLNKIVNTKTREVASLPDLESEVEPLAVNRFKSSISSKSVNLICEIKPASPTEGEMANPIDLGRYVSAYIKHADAISVLTDNEFFKGSYELLREVGMKTGLPVLQKDFVIDKKQIACGAINGASAVLLIVKILDTASLEELMNYARNLNIQPVLEVNTEEELERALSLDPEIVLINNRNLDNLEVDMNTTKILAPMVPEKTIAVGASGYSNHREIQEVNDKVKTFLVGSSLMKSDDPESRLEELKGKSRFAGVRQ